VIIAATAFDLRPASARYEAPWCAVLMMGAGDAIWDCQYRTVEECVPNVLAGNRGFCNMNPRWEGWNQPTEPRRRHGKRHARQH
jgi:hypothetical protein